MALVTEMVYITEAEFQAFTPVSTQRELEEADIINAVIEAQAVVDRYVGHVVPYEDTQDLKFPITGSDGTAEIPDSIKRATIYIASDLLLKGDPTANTGEVVSEQWSATGYSQTRGTKNGTLNETLSEMIPARAKRELRPWALNSAQATY